MRWNLQFYTAFVLIIYLIFFLHVPNNLVVYCVGFFTKLNRRFWFAGFC